MAYEVSFELLNEAGQYQLQVGPEITDLAGNQLDQDRDGSGGEVPADQFVSSFAVETSLRLDFGKSTSPVASGYRRLLETDVYAESVGYGWQENTIKSYDRATGGDLLRDFHYAPQGTFLVNLPNRRYEVVLSMGDAGGLHDQMAVFLEGTQVDTVNTAAGQYVTKTYPIAVNDGQLTLKIVDLGGTNANFVINALEVVVAGPDRLGPKVVDVLPTNLVVASVDRITLRFSEPIDVNSFDANDVSLVGPTGSVAPLAVTRISDVTYEVGFAPRRDAGQYQLRVGPEITDLAGNRLDQNGNGTGGELPADQFATSFTLEASLRLDFGKTTTPVAAGYRRLVETDLYAPAAGYGWQDNTMKSYDRATGGDLLRDFHYAPQGTFLVDLPNGRYEVVLSMGDAGALHDQMGIFLEGVQVDTVTTVAGQYAIRTYAVDVNDRQLTLKLLDQGGSNANVVVNALEVVVAGPDRLGPRVVQVSPAATVFGGTDRITLTFNEPIDVHSLGADDVSLVGPTGPVGPLTVTKLTDVTVEVAFALLSEAGQYQLLVGPAIMDLAGNLLDQNGNGIGGEVPGDQYASSFTVETSLRLDFGKATSPVASGYKRVVETDVYAESVGLGWQDGTMTSYDRSNGGDLLRDFHYAPQGTFLVDLPSRRYEVVLSMGDAGGLHDQMAVFLEGIQVNTVSTAAGQYAINAYLVDVLDGQLTLKLVDLGGTNANIVINGLEISYQAGSAGSIISASSSEGDLSAVAALQFSSVLNSQQPASFFPKVVHMPHASCVVPPAQELLVGRNVISGECSTQDTGDSPRVITRAHARKQCFAELTDDWLQQILRE